MTEAVTSYAIGDWVVHNFYGIGQIIKIETRPIHGEKTPCFRVETKDAAFWFPKDQPDNPRIRPIATPKIIKRVIRVLKKTGKDIEVDSNIWRARIDEVKAKDDLVEFGELIRDLTILGTERRLNQTENKALKFLIDRLIREWSIIMEIDGEAAQHKLDTILIDHQNRKSS